jgi:hypothetical protein
VRNIVCGSFDKNGCWKADSKHLPVDRNSRRRKMSAKSCFSLFDLDGAYRRRLQKTDHNLSDGEIGLPSELKRVAISQSLKCKQWIQRELQTLENTFHSRLPPGWVAKASSTASTRVDIFLLTNEMLAFQPCGIKAIRQGDCRRQRECSMRR